MRLSLRSWRQRWQNYRKKTAGERIVSPLLLRILAVNVIALAILVGSLLYLGRYQERLISAELSSLRLQARLSASALGEGAVVIDEEERNILSPLLARLMIRRLVEATDTRTRLFDLDNTLVADSRILQGRTGKIQMEELKPPPAPQPMISRVVMAGFDFIDRLVEREHYPSYQEEQIQRGSQYDIVHKAIVGEGASQVWSLPQGGLLLTVTVPVQRYKQVLGAVMLSRPDTSIDAAIHEVRLDILKIFLITLVITTLLSLYLARAIAAPIRALALAADSVRHGQRQVMGLSGTAKLLTRDSIPDFSRRHDEIGDLSSALRDMAASLAQRIGAIENFAADVAHEIKNPLTSLRSAVETAERVQDPTMQRRLMAVIHDDVNRLDRLISDISNASRLDAELSRDEAAPIDVGQMLTTLVDFYSVTNEDEHTHARVIIEPLQDTPLKVMGVEVRLVQVVQNLIANALSFSPLDGEVKLQVEKVDRAIRIKVLDSGSGIPENKLTAIFDRFYSERPKTEKFGTHSGLGLSISKQIVDAHRGKIWAENRFDEHGAVIGAVFTVELPTL